MEFLNKDEIVKLREEALALRDNAAAEIPTEKKEEKVVVQPTGEAIVTPTGEVVNTPELSDDEIFALAEKRGMKVSRETLSPEQLKRQEDIEDAAKYQFAIEHNLITAEGYQEIKSIIASEGSDLTKREFFKTYKAENKDATKEDVESAYDDYYFVQKNIKETKVKRDDKGKVILKGDDMDDVEIEEIEKPKWDERVTKLGEFRRNREAENIKNGAKSVLENIDKSYSNYKTLVARATDYSKNIEKIVSETDFSAYQTTHKIGNKEISAKVKFEKPDEIKADLSDYLNVRLAKLMVGSESYKDISEIKKQANAYLRDKYSQIFEENLWNLGKTEGINEAKVGSSSPIERELISDDSRVDEIQKEVAARLPDNPLFNKAGKR